MKRYTLSRYAAVLGLAGAASLAAATAVPTDFQVRLVTTGLDHPMALEGRPTNGKMYVAETGADRMLEIDLRTGEVLEAMGTYGSHPMGLACFSEGAYVGNAGGFGIVKCYDDGFARPFALMDKEIAGLACGSGAFGKDLYAVEWTAGKIWRVNQYGQARLFTQLPAIEPCYMEFSPGAPFGEYLYVTDFATGDIYRVTPKGHVELFTSTGTTHLAGCAFSPGGAFGKYFYVGDAGTGEIFRIDWEGNVELWADGFEGVADILFKPGKRGDPRMYVVDETGGPEFPADTLYPSQRRTGLRIDPNTPSVIAHGSVYEITLE